MISSEAQKVKEEFALTNNLEDILNTPVAEQRKGWENAVADVPLPEGTLIKKVTINTIYAEWVNCQTSLKEHAILYCHGGGYTMGSPITHRKLAAHLSLISGIPVLVHEYRLAPENPYPAALEDTEEVYNRLLDNGFKPENIILGGDSAGGGLAAALMLLLKSKQRRLPSAAFLLSPWFDLTLSGESIKSKALEDPFLFEEDLRITANHYCSPEDADNPLISPLFGELKGLPPLFIQTGSHDILLSDSTGLAEKARAAGVDVELDIWEQMWHVFQAWADDVPEANGALERIGRFINKIVKS